MYESPIDIIISDMQTKMVEQQENMILEAVKNVGINVDKDELIKALQHDRHQYTKGYEDATYKVREQIKEDLDQIRSAIWDLDIPEATSTASTKYHRQLEKLVLLVREKIEKWENVE